MHRFPRLVMAVMVVAAMLSSGGFAKHAHLWSAHSHHACGDTGGACISHALQALCGHDHADANADDHADAHADAGSDTGNAPARHRPHAHVDGECGVCAELAFLTPTAPLASPFHTILTVLAAIHDREAAQHPDPAAPAACAARPPPSRA